MQAQVTGLVANKSAAVGVTPLAGRVITVASADGGQFRGAAGAATVLVVNEQNKVEARAIDVERTVGNKVVVSHGLKAGERIVIEGSQKAPPGAMVNPVPFKEPAAGAPAKVN